MKLVSTPALSWFIALISFCHHQRECNSSMEMRKTKKNLVILSLLPYPDTGIFQPSWDEGPTLTLAAELAIEHINANPNILPNFNLTIVQADSGCNIKSKAYLALIRDNLMSGEPVVGMIGPGCSVSASIIGELSGKDQLSLVNVHIAGSLLLANRNKYPFSFGTLDSTEVFVETLIELIKRNKWNHVSALYDESRLYYYSTIQVMENQTKDNPDSNYFYSAVYNTYIPLNIIQNNYKVILLFVGPDFLSKILCLAWKYRMVYPVYQFVIVSRVVEEIKAVNFTYNNELVTCNSVNIHQMITNMLIIHYQLKPFNVSMATDSGLCYEEFIETYHHAVLNSSLNPRKEWENYTSIEPSFWASSYFDAVWSLALALNNSMDSVNLSAYRFGHLSDAEILRKKLLELNYMGVSGHITFDNTTGYVQRNVEIYQISPLGEMREIGYYSRINESIYLTDTARFINGEFNHLVRILTAPKSLAAIMLALTIIGLLLVLLLQILTIIYRTSKSIKASSPKLTQFAFIGCYTLGLGSILNACVETFTDQIAHSTICMLWHVINIASAIGTTLIFGTVCMRTWRLYRIFVHYKNPGRFLSEKILIVLVIMMVGINIIISIAWSLNDPFVPLSKLHKRSYEEVKTNNVTTNIRIVDEMIYSCQQERNFLLWCFSLMFFNVILVGGTVILAFLTRNIPHKDFKTRGIMSLSYILTGILGLGFALYTVLLLQLNTHATTLRLVTAGILFNIYIYLSCVLLFLPPLYPQFKLRITKMLPYIHITK